MPHRIARLCGHAALCLLGQVLGAPSAAWQEPGAGGPPQEVRVDLELTRVDFGEASAGALDVGLVRSGFSVDATIPRGTGFLLLLGGEVQTSRYDLGGLPPSLEGADVQQLDTYDLSTGAIWLHSRERQTFVRVRAKASLAPGVDAGDALRGGLIGGVRFQRSESLAFLAGAAAFTRLEEDPLFVPALGLEWRLREGLDLELGYPESRLTWAAAERAELGLLVHFAFEDFRLAQEGVLKGGVLRDEVIALELRGDLRLGDWGGLHAGIGLPLRRELSLEDSSGRTLLEEDLDGDPYLAFGLELNL